MSNLCDYKDCLEPAEVNGLCRLHYGQDMDERQADKDRIAELEARIDALMQEYCPDDMTEEQWTEWAKHQVPENQHE